jgi:hypothetical protein
LYGIDSSTYDQSLSSNNDVISATVASFITGVTSSDVAVTTISSSVSTIHAGHIDSIAMNLRTETATVVTVSLSTSSSSSSQCTVTYTVTIPDIYADGYDSPSDAYTVATASLNTSITTGTFTTVMNSNAVSSGSTLTTAEGGPATYSTYTVTSTGSSSSNRSSKKHGLRIGGIIGVVIAIMVVVVVIGMLIYYYSKGQGSVINYLQTEQEMNPVIMKAASAPEQVKD